MDTRVNLSPCWNDADRREPGGFEILYQRSSDSPASSIKMVFGLCFFA